MFSVTQPHYDALYRSKDYAGEARRVLDLVARHAPTARSLLDVACATGNHLREFAPHFADVAGVDLDDALLDVARTKLPGVQFTHADMTRFDLGRRFDVVSCLYGSIAYTQSPTGFRAAVQCMRRHVAPGGLLLIEPWWTCAAEVVPITVRHVDEPGLKIGRVGRARIGDGVVDLEVHYLVGDHSGVDHRVEHHLLGLFSLDEHQRALADAGLDVVTETFGLIGRGLVVGMAPA